MLKRLILIGILATLVLGTVSSVHADTACPATTCFSYGPTGTITTSYPTIFVLIHTYNAFVSLNATGTSLTLDGQAVGFTASLANIIPGDSSWTADIAISYLVQTWLVAGTHTVRLDVVILGMGTLTKQWSFTVAYDLPTRLMIGMNSTLYKINSTLTTLALDYAKIWTMATQWGPTLQTMNNTMHYWNSTIQNTWNVISNIQTMFSSGGTIYNLINDAKTYVSYVLWGLAGLGILMVVMAGVIVVVVLRRTRQPSMPLQLAQSSPPRYPPQPATRQSPQVTMAQPPPPDELGGVRQSKVVQDKCSNCGNEVRQQALFCSQCKARLIREDLQGGPPA